MDEYVRLLIWGLAQLDDRLKREGVKTHKQRVEELNKYLSTLSEHHDMYVFIPSLIARLLVLWLFIRGQKRMQTQCI